MAKATQPASSRARLNQGPLPQSARSARRPFLELSLRPCTSRGCRPGSRGLHAQGPKEARMEEGSRGREGVEQGGLSLHLRSSLLARSLLPSKGDPGRSGRSKSHPLPCSLSPSPPLLPLHSPPPHPGPAPAASSPSPAEDAQHQVEDEEGAQQDEGDKVYPGPLVPNGVVHLGRHGRESPACRPRPSASWPARRTWPPGSRLKTQHWGLADGYLAGGTEPCLPPTARLPAWTPSCWLPPASSPAKISPSRNTPSLDLHPAGSFRNRLWLR